MRETDRRGGGEKVDGAQQGVTQEREEIGGKQSSDSMRRYLRLIPNIYV